MFILYCWFAGGLWVLFIWMLLDLYLLCLLCCLLNCITFNYGVVVCVVFGFRGIACCVVSCWRPG